MTVIRRRKKDGTIRHCAVVWKDGRTQWIGTFATASEAHYAEEHFERVQRSTWDAYSETWLARKRNIADSSRQHYRFIISVVTSRIGGMSLKEISPALVEDLVAHLPYSPKVTRSVTDTMRMVYRSAIRDGLATSDPTQGLTNLPKRRNKRKVKALTDAEIRRIAEASPAHYRPMFELWPLVGLRRGEMFGLTWSSVFDDHIRVNHQFTGGRFTSQLKTEASYRDVPLNDEARQILKEWKPLCPPSKAGIVFPTPQGYFIAGSVASDLFARVKKDSHVDFVSHEFRHTFASNLLAHNTPKVVATLLGHANPSETLSTYAHLLPSAVENAVETLPTYRKP